MAVEGTVSMYAMPSSYACAMARLASAATRRPESPKEMRAGMTSVMSNFSTNDNFD